MHIRNRESHCHLLYKEFLVLRWCMWNIRSLELPFCEQRSKSLFGTSINYSNDKLLPPPRNRGLGPIELNFHQIVDHLREVSWRNDVEGSTLFSAVVQDHQLLYRPWWRRALMLDPGRAVTTATPCGPGIKPWMAEGWGWPISKTKSSCRPNSWEPPLGWMLSGGY